MNIKIPYLLQQIVSNDFSYLDFFKFIITENNDYIDNSDIIKNISSDNR